MKPAKDLIVLVQVMRCLPCPIFKTCAQTMCGSIKAEASFEGPVEACYLTVVYLC